MPNPPAEGATKTATADKKKIEEALRKSSICYLPSWRREHPHWLNSNSVRDVISYSDNARFEGRLGRDLLAAESAEKNKAWIRDVVTDARSDFEYRIVNSNGKPQLLPVATGLPTAQPALAVFARINQILRETLRDAGARFIVGPRSAGYRVGIVRGDGKFLSSIDQLSAGQAVVFNMFATILRHGDMSGAKTPTGIALIDEIDAHLDADLQYEVLPKLIRMFPDVQFIVTTHSPLFLMGMEKSTEGRFRILEAPSGIEISCERFSEFERSYKYFKSTALYEAELSEVLGTVSRPLILLEGKLDESHVKHALRQLGHEELLEKVDIRQVGASTSGGSSGGGSTGLNAAWRLLPNHGDLLSAEIVLLYDCDTNVPDDDQGRVHRRRLPKNLANGKVTVGVENLYPSGLFEERFYSSETKVGNYGEEKVIGKFDKSAFADAVAAEQFDEATFEGFRYIAELIQALTCDPPSVPPSPGDFHLS